MNYSRFTASARTMLALLVLWGRSHLSRLIKVIKACPRAVVREVQRPSTQYRMALVLVALLALLLGWSLTLPHAEISAFSDIIL